MKPFPELFAQSKSQSKTAQPTTSGEFAELLAGVPEGQRHEALKKLVGRLVGMRVSKSDAWEQIQNWNIKNAPPIPDDELYTQFDDMWTRWATEPNQIPIEEAIASLVSLEAEEQLSAISQILDGRVMSKQEYVVYKDLFKKQFGFNKGDFDILVTARKREQENESIEEPLSAEERAELVEAAGGLLNDIGVLHAAVHIVEDLGTVGERPNIGAIYLSIRSRALERPINNDVNSPSSAGKTHLVSNCLKIEHPSAFYELTAMSEKSLVYTREPLKNRIVFVHEPEGLPNDTGRAFIKSLTWDGKLTYDTVASVQGEIVGIHIEKEGPTGLIVASTRPLEEQLSNRMFPIKVNDSKLQTKRIIRHIALSMNGHHSDPDLEPWHALSRLTGDPAAVDIPYGTFLGERVSEESLRMRRAFSHLLSFIGSSAILYQNQRDVTSDGRIIATVSDYAHVHALIGGSFEAAQSEGLNSTDRETYEAVVKLYAETGLAVKQIALAKNLNLAPSSVSYRVRKLLRSGYLDNEETRRYRPAKLTPGTPLPVEPPGLPSPCDLARYLLEIGQKDLITPWVDPIGGHIHDCRKHLSLDPSALPPKLIRIFEPWCPRCHRSPGKGSMPPWQTDVLPGTDVLSQGANDTCPSNLSPELGIEAAPKPGIFGI